MNLSEVVAALKEKRITPAEAKSVIAALTLSESQSVDDRMNVIQRSPDRNVPAASTLPSAQLKAELIGSLAEVLYLDSVAIDPARPFSEQGLDSILGVEWVRSIEKRYGVAIASTTLYAHPTVDSLAEYLLVKLGSEPNVSLPINRQIDTTADLHPSADSRTLGPIPPAVDVGRRKRIEKELCASLAEALYADEQDLDADVPFSELGLDSIIGIEWVRSINQVYTLSVPATKLYEYPTLRLLAGYVAEQAPETSDVARPVSLTPPGTPALGQDAESPSIVQDVPVESRLDNRSILSEAVAIIGAAGRFPGSKNLDIFWENLASGKDCISEIPAERWSMEEYFSDDPGDVGKSYSKWLGAVEDADKFDPQFFHISPAEAERIDPQQRLFLEACWHCLEDAGVKPSSLSGSHCGVFVGCAPNDYGVSFDAETLTPEALTGNSLSILSARIAYFLNLKGPCLAIETSCSSSLVALSQACDSLMSGQSDLALAGGVCVLAGPRMHTMTSQAGMLSRSGRCFTFDDRADGFVPGEGVGVVLLKRLSDAVRDGDSISAIVRGVGINQDGKTNGITAPSASSQAALAQSVYKRSKITPDSISFVEAHGTATKLGDPIEVEALTNAFRHFTSRQEYCALGSVKSNIGHLLAAAGIAGVLKVLLAMRHRKLPPTIHFERLNRHVSLKGTPFFINDSLQPWASPPGVPRRGAISSFGFSGTNAHVVLEEYVATEFVENRDLILPAVILLSARSEDQLRTLAAELLQGIDDGRVRDEDLHRVAYTLQTGRDEMDCRLAFVADSLSVAANKLRLYIAGSRAGSEINTGIVDRGDETLSAFADDEDIQKAIDSWLKHGKHARLARLWVRGMHVDWRRLYPDAKYQRVRLPLYPFARERYWSPSYNQITQTGDHGMLSHKRHVVAPERIDTEKVQEKAPGSLDSPMTFKEHLEPHDLDLSSSTHIKRVICLVESEQMEEEVTRAFREYVPDTEVIFIRESTHFERHSTGRYDVEQGHAESVAQAFRAIHEERGPVDTILCLSPLENTARLNDTGTLLLLLQAISSSHIDCSRICVVTKFNHAIDRCYAESWIGFERSLRIGMPDLAMKIICLEMGAADGQRELNQAPTERDFWLKIVLDEIIAGEDRGVVYKAGKRYRYGVRRLDLETKNTLLRSGATYLIVGGAGGLGGLVADYLAKRYHARIVLIGRSSENRAIREQLTRLRDEGAEAVYLQASVYDAGSMRRAVLEARRLYGGISGVVHAAATLDKRMVLEKDASSIEAVLAPKIRGIQILDEVLNDEDRLEFIAYFSSSSAVLGDPGWCDYAAANRFMAAYASYMPALGTAKRVAINWPLWSDGGIQFDSSQSRDLYLQASGQRLLETDEGLNLFDRILRSNESDVLVMAGSRQKIEKAFEKFRFDSSKLNVLPNQPAGPRSGRAPHLKGLTLAECIAWDLKEQTSKLLEIARERLDAKRNLLEFGFDSIGLGRFANLLSKHYSVALTPAVFFSYATLEALTGYLLADHSSAMEAFYGEADNQVHVSPDLSATQDSDGSVPEKGVLSHTLGGQQKDSPAGQEPIAVIGISGRFPQARNIHELWEILAQGRDVIEEIPRDRFDCRTYYGDPQKDHDKTNCKWMGSIPGVSEFDALFFDMSPLEGESVDPRQRLLLQEAWNALEDAAYGPLQLERQRVGVYVGAERGDYEALAQRDAAITSNHDGILATRLSYFLDLRGPAMTINTACSSGLVAAHQACLSLRVGECDVAIAAGVNVLSTSTGFLAMGRAGMLSPDGRCRAFDQSANGMVPAEAVVAVVLKPLARAEADGDPIYAVIRGSGINYDGKTNGITAPSGSSQADLLCEIYDRLRLNPRSIDYIVTHGTGTKIGDPIEANALCEAFKKYTSDTGFCALTSTKSNLGHSFAASGLVSLVSLVLAMRNRTIPATLHCGTESDYVHWSESPFFINKTNRSWANTQSSRRIGCVSSFGMSGTNAHMVLESYDQSAPELLEAHPPRFLLVLSAKTEEALEERAQNLMSELRKEKRTAAWLYAASYTLLCGRHHFDHRCAVVVTDAENALFMCSQIGGKESWPNLFRGKVRQGFQPGNAISQYAEGLLTGLNGSLLDQDKYQDSLYALADLFCQGYEASWSKLFNQIPFQRISLPGYPFAKERLWPGSFQRDMQEQVEVVRPTLVAPQNQSILAESAATKYLTGHESFLTDHILQGLPVLPAVAYLEIVREAVEQNAAKPKDSREDIRYLSFENVVFSQPLVVYRPCDVRISLNPGDQDDYTYSVYSEPKIDDRSLTGDENRIIHSAGVLTRRLIADGSRQLLREAAFVSSESFSPEACYQRFEEMGLHYGPAHRGLIDLVAGIDAEGRRLACAQVAIPQSVLEVDAYVLHLGLLDAALQASIGLTSLGVQNGSGPKALLPFAIDRVDIFHHCSASARVVLVEKSASESMYTFDADLFDDQGEICVQFRGFHARRLGEGVTKPEAIQAKGHAASGLYSLVSRPVFETASLPALSAVEPVISVQEVTRSLGTFLAQTLKVPAHRIEPSAPFEKYGIDSLSVIQLTAELEKVFGTLPKTLFFEYANIGELAVFFCENYPSKLTRLPGMGAPAAGSTSARSTVNPMPSRPRDIASYSLQVSTLPKIKERDNRAIAIIGIAGKYPQASSLDEFWKNLSSKKDCISEIPVERWDHSIYFDRDKSKTGKSYSKWGGFIDGVDRFDPLFFNISPREAELMDPQERLFLQCAYETLEDAGYTRATLGRYEGLGLAGNVGVFVGVMYQEYQLFGAQAQMSGEPLALFGSPASIANRVSYFCNFHGPSMAVDTMCSSSLTAIHLACESLLSGGCEAAIAGGVNVSIHPNKYLTLSRGQFASSIGRCESFGVGGDGYVPGEGVGAVLLKPLDKAVVDRDRIYGVIQSSAVNHGGKSNGYSVPNPNAQANVIAQALQQLQTPVRAISYVETHGTGTSLGDPIEIAGLSKAFGGTTQEKQFCAIGSVKSNIGHCESAAGIAGLTKVLLQMQHGTLVPSIHSETLNPHIDFKNSPFVVQRELGPWERPTLTVDGEPREFPRIAGLSSFGAGGSNAHLIISEYTAGNAIEGARSNDRLRPVVVLLSARTEKQLRLKVQQLGSYLEEKHLSDDDLSNLAYTLQVGREAMEHRAALVVATVTELGDKLKDFLVDPKISEHVFVGDVSGDRTPLGLFTSDEDVQQTVNAWMEKGKYDKLCELWVSGGFIDWEGLYRDTLPRRMSLPTYPFANDRYWAPVHTPGVSNVGLVEAGQLHPLVHCNTSDFSTQRYTSTFTRNEPIFKDHVVSGLRILPAAAYMEMAFAAVMSALSKPVIGSAANGELRLREVEFLRPLIAKDKSFSVHTSLDIDEDGEIQFTIYTEDRQGEDIVHCRGRAFPQQQARESERPGRETFAAQWIQELSGDECYERFRAAGLEYGPTHRLLSSVFMGASTNDSQLALAAYRIPESLVADFDRYLLHPSILDAALQATMGAFPGGDSQHAFVPVEIEAIEVWSRPTKAGYVKLARADVQRAAGPPVDLDINICDEEGTVCVRIMRLRLQALQRNPANMQSSTLLLKRELERAPVPQESTDEVERNHWVWLSTSSERVAAKWEQVASIFQRQHPDIQTTQLVEVTGQNVAEKTNAHAAQVFELIQRAFRQKLLKDTLVQLVVPTEERSTLFSSLVPLLRTAHLENPRFIPQILFIDDGQSAETLVRQLLLDGQQSSELEVYYHRGERWVPRWKELAVSDATASAGQPWANAGSYLITGGAGGLGLLFAREICQRTSDAKIMLTGRSPLSEEKRLEIEGLRTLGGRVEYRQMDVEDRASVIRTIAEIQSMFGGLQGIIHSAGIIKDNFVINKTREEFQSVLAPKCAGIVNLDEATKELPMDFFVMFSSLAGVMGNVGQSDYATANAFMDEFARYRSALVDAGRRSGRSVAIDWPLWQEGGMHIDAQLVEHMRLTTGLLPLQTSAGIRSLYDALQLGVAQVMVVHQENSRPFRYPGRAVEEVPVPASVDSVNPRLDLHAAAVVYLKSALAKTLKLAVSQIEANAPLERYGIDSVLMMQMTSVLEKDFGPLPKTLFFEYQSIAALAGYLAKNHHGRLAEQHESSNAVASSLPKERASAAVTGKWESRVRSGIRREPAKIAVGKTDWEDIAIIGLSGRYPGADDLHEFWENLKDGKDSVSEIPPERWDHSKYFDPEKGKPGKSYSKWGGFLKNVDVFDPLFFNISPREAKMIDPQERLILQCAYEALEDAGYTRASVAGHGGVEIERNVGVFIGVMYEEYQLFGAQSHASGQPFALSGSPSSIANRVSYFCNFHGPSLAVDTMCSSSLTAIHLACQSLNQGECAVAVAGGVNLSIHPNKYIGLAQALFVSSRGRCESFGEGGEGYVPSEGVGTVLLKPLAKAVADRDHIYGVLKATAINHGGKNNGYSVPNPVAQGNVIARALRKSGLPARALSYIEAHGTGTKLGDPVEVAGLIKAFSAFTDDRQFCAIGSVKSNIGHCESAAGIAGLTKILLQLENGQLAPSLHAETLNSNIDFGESPFIVQRELGEWKRPVVHANSLMTEYPRIAGLSSFGAGGSNAHFIIEEYVEARGDVESSERQGSDTVVVVLSAKSAGQRIEQAARLLEAVARKRFKDKDLVNIAYTLQVGREAMEYRMAFTAASIDELERKLRGFVGGDLEGEEVFLGDMRQSKGNTSMFAGDEELATVVDHWFQRGKYRQLMEAWTNGVDVNWQAFYREAVPQRISLPTYPFAKEHYWIDKASWMQVPVQPAEEPSSVPREHSFRQKEPISHRGASSTPGRAQRFVTKQWRQEKVQPGESRDKRILIATTEETKSVANLIASRYPGSVILQPIPMDPLSVPLVWGDFNCWVDLTGCGNERSSFRQLITALQQWIVSNGDRELTAICVTRQLESFKNEEINLAGALPAGLYRILQSEYKSVRSRHMDIDRDVDDQQVVDQIVSELTDAGEEPEVCYRAGERYRSTLEDSKDFLFADGTSRTFPTHKVLWITGGARGLGYLCAQHFVRNYGVKRVVLLGCEVLPPTAEWRNYRLAGDSIGKKILAIQALESLGAEVKYTSVSLTDLDALRNEFTAVEQLWGPIGGLIHCAGVMDSLNPAFLYKTSSEINSVLSPKVEGLDNLLSCVADKMPEFVVLFSSVSAAIPALGVGQTDYAMANAYLDYTAAAFANKLTILSLQWPSWSESGYGEVKGNTYRTSGLLGHSDEEGLSLLDQLVSAGRSLIGIPAIVDEAIWEPARLMGRSLHAGERTRVVSGPRPPETGDIDRQAIQQWLVSLVCEFLSMQPGRVDIDTPLYDYGVDSVMFAQFGRQLAKIAGENLDPSVFFEHTDLRSLATWLMTKYGEKMMQAIRASAEPKSEPVLISVYEPGKPYPPSDLATGRAPSAKPLDIAVVGMACRFPGAENLDKYWRLLAEGRSAIVPVPKERWGTGTGYYAGLIANPYDFDPGFFRIPADTAAVMDTQALLVLEETLKLFCHAGYSVEDVKGSATGVYLGARSGDRGSAEVFQGLHDPVMAAGQNYLAANVSRFFDFHGPSLVIDSACSSALVSMQLAAQALQSGDIAAAVVGGVSVLHDAGALQIFKQRGILSPAPKFHLFDGRSQGAVLGEGAGLVLLKTVEQAKADGDTIYAVIEAIAVNNDGRTVGSGAPNTQAQREVMQQALGRSGFKPEEITYIDVNGSGSEITDLLELRVIEAVYRSGSKAPCILGSMKPNIGHPLTAEGIASFIRVALMLHHERFVPFLSGEMPMKHYDLKSSPFRFPRELSTWESAKRIAAINCFADGGTNVHVILSAPEQLRSSSILRKPIHLPKLQRFDVRAGAVGTIGDSGNGKSDKANGSGVDKTSARATRGAGKNSFWNRPPKVDEELVAINNSWN
jgi:acyl transferase domain-containing protein/NAD(P)-dependent dehydrogenase (short-subunit alcohol dehydrogenase family)/acyl carrier protein